MIDLSQVSPLGWIGIIFAVCWIICGLANWYLFTHSSTEGYEDETGFHYGRPK